MSRPGSVAPVSAANRRDAASSTSANMSWRAAAAAAGSELPASPVPPVPPVTICARWAASFAWTEA
ncbi:hypothetical protein, partial [Corynebacterium variabile]|uniref:hypothetical protein n=1 Tax=Corynebacterium variabile TaxID=1727 RepID=UPI0028A938BB